MAFDHQDVPLTSIHTKSTHYPMQHPIAPSTLERLLHQYWGYPSFRPFQASIIQAVLAGKDVIALLPTGGGKSICFQLPALCQAGTCLVISPLIALMTDQVAQLKKKGIAAAALFAGMRYAEIDRTLDNCLYGTIKLLYVSPERLQTELFQERVKQMQVNLLAVDEAHCISQWGYDFRPSYLEIARLKEMLPSVPTLALTATATQAVKKDIAEKLQLQNPCIFQQSGVRTNLIYQVHPVERKEDRLLQLLEHIPGSAIVYTHTRSRTQIVASFLEKKGISAGFYHAGLPLQARAQQQDAWLRDQIRVMVATTAFGMGINKAAVRLVVHFDLPTTLEAYYQEAGRAGRDEQKAYAVVLYDEEDIVLLRHIIHASHPSLAQLKQVYQHLANYYQIAVGTHALTTYDFDLVAFARTYNLPPTSVYQALKKLETEGLIQLTTHFFQLASVYIRTKRQDLYAFQITHAAYDATIKALLRLYGGGLFVANCAISEKRIAHFLHIAPEQVTQQLHALHRLGIIDYRAQKEKPQLTFLTPRYPAHQLPLQAKAIQQKKARAMQQAEAVIAYVTQHACRVQRLVAYFGEDTPACGQCDTCSVTSVEQAYRPYILQRVQQGIHEVSALINSSNPQEEAAILKTIRHLLDEEILVYDAANRLLLSTRYLK